MIFLFPTEIEARLFRAKSPDAQVIITGVGMAACGASLSRVAMQNPTRRLILGGIAGSYDTATLAIGEVVEVVEESIEELPRRYQTTYINSSHTSLRGVTSNSVSSSHHTSTRALVENMEGAIFFSICRELGVDFCEIRAISNRVGDPFERWEIERAIEALTEKLLEISLCE